MGIRIILGGVTEKARRRVHRRETSRLRLHASNSKITLRRFNIKFI